MNTRSTTGCGTCKTRRKKCDETHPKCQNCLKLGLECSGYQYVETTPHIRGSKKPRTRRGPFHEPIRRRAATSKVSRRNSVTEVSDGLGSLLDTSTSNSSYNIQVIGTSLALGTLPTNSPLPTSISDPSPAISEPFNLSQPSSSSLCFSSQSSAKPAQPNFNDAVLNIGKTRFYYPGYQPTNSLENPDSTVHTDTAAVSSATLEKGLVTGTSSEPLSEPIRLSADRTTPQSGLTLASSCFLGNFSSDPNWKVQTSDDDPEGVRHILFVSPAMDSSVPDNFLPFALQNGVQWILLVIFEPLKISQTLKQHITHQISYSDATRTRMMLISRVIGALLKNPVPDQSCKLAVSILHADIDQKTAHSTLERTFLEPSITRQRALEILVDYLDVIVIQVPTYPFRSWYQLLRNAAPVFRDACPDPLGQPVYLPGILSNPPFSLLFFVALDVATSITSGRPMLCKYDAGFSLELCDQLFENQQNYGFQWLHGIPDQFILLLAWINTLYERHGMNVEPRVLARIEDDLPKIRIPPVGSTDPALQVGRAIVQEGWRQAVYIYFYMTLYGANARDQRVEQARKIFMRLVNGTNPGRSSDGFLVIPMMIVGVVSLKRRDRNTIRERILGLRECRNPESAWNDNVRMMEDIWIRTAAEARPATWLDLRIACYKITGI